MGNRHIGSDFYLFPDGEFDLTDVGQDPAWGMTPFDPDALPPEALGIDPSHHHTETDGRIFVFGSNTEGWHGGGAAGYASRKLGAVQGVGEGPMGRCYALPTCFEPGLPVDVGTLQGAVARFNEYARLNPSLRFFVSEVGCGIAGFYVCEVAPLFMYSPPNVDLPPGWRDDTYLCGCPTHGLS